MPDKPANLVLYGRHASPFVRRVAVTLRLYDIGYRHVPLMPFGPDKAELARFNPIARVPAPLPFRDESDPKDRFPSSRTELR